MVVDKKLIELANIFSPYATLYAVGGFARDSYLGLECSDIDVCSSLEANKVKEILSNSNFIVQEKNLRVGTLIIVSHNFKVEYTTFRVDSYDKRSGNHSPEDIVFTDDIKKDALRRDFKCNALYYDICKDEYVDILGSIEDIKNKTISTTDKSDTVFEADGLRILRLVRFASELGFIIEEETFESAKRNAWRVKDISVERIKEELDKIFVADTKHLELKLDNAHVRGFNLLDDLGLVEMLLPEVYALKGLEQPVKYHLYDAYNHSIMTYKASTPQIRWAAICHDIGKRPCMDKQGNMYGHDFVGADMGAEIANRYKFSKEEKREFVFLIKYHMVDMQENMRSGKLRRFVGMNFDMIDKLIDIKRADCFGSCGVVKHFEIEDVYDLMKNDGSPRSIKDLNISGEDLIELNVEEKMRGILMKEIFEQCLITPTLNDRNELINYVKRKVKTK